MRLTFKLVQNHGGWNSDDNQNNNLGRFRFSVTGAENAVADPLPAAVREILAMPAAERTPEQVDARVQLLADDRPRVAGSESPDRGPVAEPSRRARRNWCCIEATRAARQRIGSSAAISWRRRKR